MFPNTGKEVVFVQTNATAGGTDGAVDIGTTIQGQTVPGGPGGIQPRVGDPDVRAVPVAVRPARRHRQNVEIDFGTPANVSGVVVVRMPGVI